MANRLTMTSATLLRRAEPRGLTLLELLISIAIVIGIGAIALPYTFQAFERRESAAAIDHLAMQVLLARALAREDGVPLALMVDSTGRRLEVRTIDPRAPLEPLPAEAPPMASWRRLLLPEGISIDVTTEGTAVGEPALVRLAMFMPDGHVVATAPFMLHSDKGIHRLSIDSWTGRIELEQLVSEGDS